MPKSAQATHQVGARVMRALPHSEQPFCASSASRSRQLREPSNPQSKTQIVSAKVKDVQLFESCHIRTRSHPVSPAPCVLDALAVGSEPRLVQLPRGLPDGGLSRVPQDVAERAAGRLQQGTHALRMTGLMMPTVSASLRLPRLLSDAGSRGFPQDVAECAASLLQCEANVRCQCTPTYVRLQAEGHAWLARCQHLQPVPP